MGNPVQLNVMDPTQANRKNEYDVIKSDEALSHFPRDIYLRIIRRCC